MAGVGVGHVDFHAPELRDLDRKIRAAASKRRMRLLMEGLAKAGEDTTDDRIKRGGPAPDGRDWPARHPLSASRKPLLNRDGHLGDSIAMAATNRTARWGTNLNYARIHQLGGIVRPRRRRALRFEQGGNQIFARRTVIPARPYLGWGAQEERQVGLVIRHWLDEALD